MSVHTAFGFSQDIQEKVWDYWKAGFSFSDIARAVRKAPGCVHRLIGYYGGIRPVSRKRSKKVLSLEEREEISRGIATGSSFRQIARQLGRAASTIYREVHRHRGRQHYRASSANECAWRNACRPKESLLTKNMLLKNSVIEKLFLKWSPEQISGWLR